MATLKVVKLKNVGRKHGGSRKIGRNKAKCARYRLEGRREKNAKRRKETQKRRKLKKEIKLQKRRLSHAS